MADSVFTIIGRAIIPKRARPELRQHLLKAGYHDIPYNLFSMIFFIACVLTYVIYLALYAKIRVYNTVAVGFLSFVVIATSMFLLLFVLSVMMYFYWNIKIYNRTKELEILLPDYLMLVSTNLKGGMSFENALWSAIKPEFGILANEIGLVSKRVMTGNDVAESLREFSMKYDSPILRRNIQLLMSEAESGGKIVETIDHIIDDLRKVQVLKKEMAASTITYMIFIGMIVVLICPVLFALSLQLFQLTSTFVGGLSGKMAASSTNFSPGTPGVTKEDFRVFSILAISIISVFSSMIIAVIEKGNVKSGMKYIPMFLVSSITIYFLASILLNYLFGSIKLAG